MHVFQKIFKWANGCAAVVGYAGLYDDFGTWKGLFVLFLGRGPVSWVLIIVGTFLFFYLRHIWPAPISRWEVTPESQQDYTNAFQLYEKLSNDKGYRPIEVHRLYRSLDCSRVDIEPANPFWEAKNRKKYLIIFLDACTKAMEGRNGEPLPPKDRRKIKRKYKSLAGMMRAHFKNLEIKSISTPPPFDW